MLPYESRLNAPTTPSKRPLNAFAANRAMDSTPPPRSLTALVGRMALPYAAATGSGGFDSPPSTAKASDRASPAVIHQGTTHVLGQRAGKAIQAPGRMATEVMSGRAPAPPRRLIDDRQQQRAGTPDSASLSQTEQKMTAAQTPEMTSGPRGALIGRPTTPQDDMARATQAARALQDVLGDRRLRQFRSTRQALASEFSRAMGAQASQHSQSSGAQENRALEQARQAHDAQQANANRRQQAAQFNAQQLGQAQLSRRALDTQRDQPWQMSQSADGTPGIIRSSGRFTPITGPDGQLVALAQPQQALSPETLFKAFTEAENAIRSGLAPPEEQQAQLNQLYRNPLYQPLLRRGAPSEEAQLTPNGQWVRQLPDGRWQAYGE